MKSNPSLDIDFTDDDLAQGADDIVNDDTSAGLALIVDDEVVDENAEPTNLPARARKNADGSVTLTFLYPQKLKRKSGDRITEETFSQITMHRLNGGDQLAIATAPDNLINIVAFARSTRMAQAAMNVLYAKLDMADITAMGMVLSHFFGNGQTTGK